MGISAGCGDEKIDISNHREEKEKKTFFTTEHDGWLEQGSASVLNKLFTRIYDMSDAKAAAWVSESGKCEKTYFAADAINWFGVGYRGKQGVVLLLWIYDIKFIIVHHTFYLYACEP